MYSLRGKRPDISVEQIWKFKVTNKDQKPFCLPEVKCLGGNPEGSGGCDSRDHLLLQLELCLGQGNSSHNVQADVEGGVVWQGEHTDVQ